MGWFRKKKQQIPATIIIPESLLPLERGEKYEDALFEILWKHELGKIIGGGGILGDVDPADGKRPVESCSIELTLTDLDKALPLITESLIASGAPRGTTIRCIMADGTVREESVFD